MTDKSTTGAKTPPKRLSTALLNSLSAGVVPRSGLEYIAVGRKEEVAALLQDLENISEGGAAFRLILGKYGSGKSFMLQLIRNYALERNFIVADADLSPERRLAGTNGHGVGTYRELVKNLSSKARPDGGALGAILEKWISGVQLEVAQGLERDDPAFGEAVEHKILEVVGGMQNLVNGFDFASVLTSYWRGYRLEDDTLKDAALRWLRGEYSTKTEARAALGVRVIIDDDSWYDYLKLLAQFVSSVGHRGLLVLIDETVNLYKITHSVARESNYEKLLSMFNDTMQGKAERLGLFFGGTPQLLEDQRRGLFSYEALRSRLSESRFVREGLRDYSSPVLRLQTLTHEEIFVLLHRIAEVHAGHHATAMALADVDFTTFMQESVNRMGADALLTPREVVRDFVSVLNIIVQNPSTGFAQVLRSSSFKPSGGTPDPEAASDDFAEFKL
jgi:P-loop Domain of unknown function (DUF2791)